MPRGLELLIAQTILQGFDAQYGRFRIRRSRRIRQFSAPDEGAKCRVAWNY